MKVAQNSPSKKKAGLFDLIGSKSDNTDYLQKLVRNNFYVLDLLTSVRSTP